MKKLPPIEKIYEAYSAIADGRVILSDSGDTASIKSSSGEKEYTVSWRDTAYASTDNATYWQGYPGYPVIAVLMLQGKLTLDREIAGLFKGINWTAINKKYKRDYSAAVKSIVRDRKLDAQKVEAAAEKVYDKIKNLDIIIKRKL